MRKALVVLVLGMLAALFMRSAQKCSAVCKVRFDVVERGKHWVTVGGSQLMHRVL